MGFSPNRARDDAILRDMGAGVPVREISSRYQVCKSRIYQIKMKRAYNEDRAARLSEISTRARNVLANALFLSFNTDAELRVAVIGMNISPRELEKTLLSTPGCGTKTVDEILSWLGNDKWASKSSP